MNASTGMSMATSFNMNLYTSSTWATMQPETRGDQGSAREEGQLELLLRHLPHSSTPVLHGSCLVVSNVLRRHTFVSTKWQAGLSWAVSMLASP